MSSPGFISEITRKDWREGDKKTFKYLRYSLKAGLKLHLMSSCCSTFLWAVVTMWELCEVALSLGVDPASAHGFTGLPWLITKFSEALKGKLENKFGKMMSGGLLADLYSFGLCKRLCLKATEGAEGSWLSQHTCPDLAILVTSKWQSFICSNLSCSSFMVLLHKTELT